MLRVRLQHSSVEGIKSMCSGVRAEHVNISKAAAYNLFMLLFSSKKCLEQGGDWGVRGTLGLHDKFGTRVMTDFCFPEDELPKTHAGVMEARSCTWCVRMRMCVVRACIRAYVRACVPLLGSVLSVNLFSGLTLLPQLFLQSFPLILLPVAP